MTQQFQQSSSRSKWCTKSEVAKAAFESTMTTWAAQPAAATAALGVTVQSTTLKETVTVAPPPVPARAFP